MFRVTVDIFSGRPNPTWIITDEAEVNRTLTALAENPALISRPDAGFQGLGYRGVHIELFGDDATDLKLPARFAIANGASEASRGGEEIALRLIDSTFR